MDLSQFWLELCPRLQDFYKRSYGELDSSWSDEVTLPVDATRQWRPIVALPGAGAKLTIKNTDAANELEFTWNPGAARGLRLASGDVHVFDDVSGTFYARASDATKSSTVNYLYIGLRV